jgi:short subunit dehydrogenase-like uncharacterized protein
MSKTPTWMLYGAAGYAGALIAQHALDRGHRPVLAGRSAPALTALANKLDLPYRVLSLEDPTMLRAAVAEVDVVLNAAGPFLHTAAPLAEASLDAGAHYLDISNELQVFRTLYDLNSRSEQRGVAVIPGVGFGVVATNCLARYVSDAVGGATCLEVATRAATAEAGPGVAATKQASLPFGGWVRRAGALEALPLGSGIMTISLPDGPCAVMPLPTGDLEAAFHATGASKVTAYAAVPTAVDTDKSVGAHAHPSFAWARATDPDGATAQAWLETGESYAFTAAASVRAVEEIINRSLRGAFSPAAAFGADFAFTIDNTTRIDTIAEERALPKG